MVRSAFLWERVLHRRRHRAPPDRDTRMIRRLILLLALSFLIGTTVHAQAQERLNNGGFERIEGGRAPEWSAYEQGYDLANGVARSGKFSLRCVNTSAEERRGGSVTVALQQTTPQPVIISGWSRAENVGGLANEDYSLYVDLTYTDGTPLWGRLEPFDTGTHDWQRCTVRIFPAKPIRELTVYALLRRHSGTAWFDDFSVRTLPADGIFDGQPLAAPTLPSGKSEGWFARDVAADSPVQSPDRLGLRLTTSDQGAIQRAKLADTQGRDRAITLYYVRRFDSRTPTWWNDIDDHAPVSTGERANLTGVRAGAVGGMSVYPFGCVTGEEKGQAVGIPPDLGPRIARIGYHAGARLLYVAFDLALTAKAGDGKRTADAAVAQWTVDPNWGFRDAAAGYYRLFPESIRRRTMVEGIWMPFTDPKTITNVQDFGIVFHEGDNSVANDDLLGILSFRYSEPMSYWMSMPPSVPRTYANALAQLERQAAGKEGKPDEQRQARAVLTSGARQANGQFQGEFRNTPWANGIVWTLNPNPKMPGPDTKARINYTPEEANQRFTTGTNRGLDGEYLDSVESWADVPDFGAASLRQSTVPPTFTTDTLEPILPTWFSVWEFTKNLSDDLRRRGKLLMGNTVPVRFFAFAPLFDIMGIETNWINGDQWQPEGEDILRYRRTLSGPRPYLLLMNTNYAQLTSERVEAYFQRCMAWGIYPSMFSADAATNPYWESSLLYNRDRPLFRKYIPVIRQLASAGWEPVPYARANSDTVGIERFGNRFLTLRNRSNTAVTTALTVESARFAPGRAGDTITIRDVLTGIVLWQGARQSTVRFSVPLPPSGVVALEWVRREESKP